MREIVALLSELVSKIEGEAQQFNRTDINQNNLMKLKISDTIKHIESELKSINTDEEQKTLKELLVRLNYIDIQF